MSVVVKMVRKRNDGEGYMCINCGYRVKELHRKLSSAVIKLTKCDKCRQIADKYIEFEPVIILIDSILLSKCAYRHILYNADFKIHWKLSLVLLLLESFALWRQKLDEPLHLNNNEDFIYEKGFYICCLTNIIDNITLFLLLETVTIALSSFYNNNSDISFKQGLHLYKAITIANFAKFFLLPILIWKDNTTELGSLLHYLLVMGYYFLSLIQIYSVVTQKSIFRCVVVILLVLPTKQFIAKSMMTYLETNYLLI